MNTVLHECLKEAETIAVLGHVKPDGDCVGSCLALCRYIRNNYPEKRVRVWLQESQDRFSYLKGFREICHYPDSRLKPDLAVALDVSDKGRLGEFTFLFDRARHTLNIDHHVTNPGFAEMTVCEPEASSACEVLYELIRPELIDRDTAACLYCGLMTDTGAFAYNSNRAELFHIVAMLLAKGIDKDKIYRNVYYSYTESRLRLMGYLMNEKLEYFPEQHAALFALTEQEMKQFNYIRGDAEGFVNLPLQIKGTRLSISLREDTEKPIVRVSLRSIGDFPCNQMAERYFNGGGHRNAAGGWLPKPISLAIINARKAIMAEPLLANTTTIEKQK